MKLNRLFLLLATLALVTISGAQLSESYVTAPLTSGFGKNSVGVAATYDPAANLFITSTIQYKIGPSTGTAVYTGKFDPTGNLVGGTVGRGGLSGNQDEARAMTRDSAGNIYVAAEGDKSSTSSSMLLFKYDATLALQWVQTYIEVPGHHNNPVDVAVDSANRIYIGGTAGDGTGSTYAVAQYTSAGVMNWHRSFSASVGGSNKCAGMKVLPNGDTYIGGSSQPPTGAVTVWYVKYNSSGVYQFDSGYTGNPAVITQANAMTVGSDGTVAFAGTSFPIDSEFCVVVFSPTGQFRYFANDDPVSSLGFATNVGGQAVAIGSDGSVYVAGCVIPPGQSSLVQPELIRYLQNGSYGGYTRRFGSPSNLARVADIKVDAYNRVYVSYENSFNNATYLQCGVGVFDGNTGSFLANKLYSNSQYYNQAGTIAVDTHGQIYFAGTIDQVPSPSAILYKKFYQAVVIPNEFFSCSKNGTVNLDAAHGVLSKAHYVLAPSVHLVASPAHGTVTLGTSGAFIYTPNANYVGTDSFKVNTTQGVLTGNTAQIYIKVQ